MLDKPSRIFANPYLLLTIAPIFWAGNAIVGKLASEDWQPFTFTALRWIFVTLLLLPLVRKPMANDIKLVRSHGLYLMGLGAFGMGAFNLCLYLALEYTSAVNVSIEQAVMPVFIVLANFIVFRQRVVPLQALGLALSIVGVMVTATGGKPAEFFSGGLNRGDLIMIFGSLFYAAYSFGLRWRPDVHWLSFIFMVGVGASLGAIPFAIWEVHTQGFVLPPVNTWWYLGYAIIFPTLVSQLAYAKGISLIGGNRAGLFINLVPIFGSLMAVVLLGEVFRWYHAAGIVLVVGGIMLADYFAKKESRA